MGTEKPLYNSKFTRSKLRSQNSELAHSIAMQLQDLELNEQSSSRQLQILASLNPCLSGDETLLLSYYKRVRATWSNSALKNLQRATGLKLTNNLNKCKFAIEAAKLELQFHHSDQLPDKQLPVASDQLPVKSKQLSVENNQLSDKEQPSTEQQLPNDSQTLLTGHWSLVTEKVTGHYSLVTEKLQIAQNKIKELELQLVAKDQELEQQIEQQQERLERAENFSLLLLTKAWTKPELQKKMALIIQVGKTYYKKGKSGD